MKVDRSAHPASFGPYEILAPLGQGGGGTVYRAWDPRLEREVALKILHGESATDPERVRRFIAEARAASALNHPNIVTVFDAAVDGDTPYIVSELIDGRPLRSEIHLGPVPLKRLLDFATQIADGLSAAHEAGIVHRDLKPENIMIARTGRVKIVDFGLARPGGFPESGTEPSADDVQTQTEPGLRAGTIPYMSPEQARGVGTDFHSDQFSFGLILHEMAQGRPAFRRDTPAATLDAIINDELPPMSAGDTRIPVLLRWIIERCLAKDPDDRYAVTVDLHRDLRNLRDRLGEVSREPGAPAVPATTTRWRRGLIVAALLGALAIGAILSSLIAEPQTGDASVLRFTPFATAPGYEGFPAWSPDGQTIAYVAEVNDTLQIFTRRLSSPVSAQVTHASYDAKHPFWSPDGRRIYYVSLAKDREGIWSVGAAGGTAQVVVENANRGAISPDGRTLAFLRDEERAEIVGNAALWFSTPTGGEQKKYAPFDALRFNEGVLSFSPDGSKLALCVVPRSINLEPEARGWQFWILPLSAGQPYRRLQWWSDVAPRVTNFTWLPDSRHVVLGITSLSTPGSHLWMADLERDRAWSLTRGPGSESYPSASPRGEQVVFTSGEPDYDLVEISLAGNPTRPLLATARNEADPVWSLDGSLFAYVTDRNGLDEIWLRTREDRSIDRPLVTQRDFGDDRTIMLSSPSFSPDGQRIAYQRNAQRPIWPLRIWISLTAGGPPVPLLPPAHEGYQGAPSWSPDGQWIAYTEWKEREWMLVKVRVGSGEEPVVLRTDGVPNASPHWSPRNDWITWETAQGFVLVSPDGGQQRVLSDDEWLVHTWSRDGSDVFGIRESENLHLLLVTVNVRTAQTRVLADLGPSPPVNNPVKGFSLDAEGRTIATSMVRPRGDLWLLDGLEWRDSSRRWFRPFRSP
jgi:serine/threonine protein kinase/Tol biopolymer transport system component